MIKFISCPNCKAKIENIPGTTCWNCGYLVPGGEEINTIIVPDEPLPRGEPAIGSTDNYFKSCPNCEAQCEYFATRCWSCGVELEATDGEIDWKTAPKKFVPFSEVVEKPPEIKKKTSLTGKLSSVAGKIASAFKPDYHPSDESTDKEVQEERKLKLKRKLLLFHCPKCDEYFKVLFRKVTPNVKCPECKSVRMKIPYFCTRCKRTEEFFTLDKHVCKYCNLQLILDPNYE
ncbi:MAG: hypothetical protein ACTSUE_19705 [Promethearchaeota archaeon]